MSDVRVCVLCNALIDLSDLNVKMVHQPGGGRRTLVSVDTQIHILATKRFTKPYLEES